MSYRTSGIKAFDSLWVASRIDLLILSLFPAGWFWPPLFSGIPPVGWRVDEVKPWYVWLDVQQGCFIKDIKIFNDQNVAFPVQQTYYGQADSVWPTRMPRSIDAMWFIIKKRRPDQFDLPGAVKEVQQIEVGKHFDISQAGGVFFKDCYSALGA